MLGKTVINKEKHEQDIFDIGSGFESTVLAKFTSHVDPNRIKVQVIETLEEFISNLTSLKI
jgi:prephenate dehydrogenase